MRKFISILVLAALSGCATPGRHMERDFACTGHAGEIVNGQDKILYEGSLTFHVVQEDEHGTVTVAKDPLAGHWEGRYYICEGNDVAIYFEHMPVNIHQCYGSNTTRLGTVNFISGEGRLQLATGTSPSDPLSYFEYVCKGSAPAK